MDAEKHFSISILAFKLARLPWQRKGSSHFQTSILFWAKQLVTKLLHAAVKIIIAKQGYFGFVSKNSKPGDDVCILRGGFAPFMLRRRDEKYQEFGGLHEVLDGCYILMAKKEELKDFWIC